jgi:hypothetical protein
MDGRVGPYNWSRSERRSQMMTRYKTHIVSGDAQGEMIKDCIITK